MAQDHTIEIGRREFGIGRVLAQSVAMLRAQGLSFFAITVLLSIPQLVLQYLAKDWMIAVQRSTNGFALAIGQILAITLSQVLVAVLGYCLIQGAIGFGCLEALRGRRAGFGACLGRSFRALGPMLVFTVILTVGLGLFGGGLGFAMIRTGGWPAMLLLGAVGLAVLLLVTVVWWVVMPAIVQEEIGAIAGMRRSRRLTAGHRWRILGLLLVVAVPLVVVATLGLRFSGLDPSGLEIANTALGLVGTTIGSVMPAVGYFLLRAEKEGFGGEEIANVFD